MTQPFRLEPSGMQRSAAISPCGKYRYLLTRTWSAAPPLHVCMLNPSTADAQDDDATISVLIGRARRMDCGGLVVVNLYAWRATHPRDLAAAERNGDDIVGPDNDYTIRTVVTAPGNNSVLCAWGNSHPVAARVRRFRELLRAGGIHPYHLGLTSDGQPRHPLRVPYSQPLLVLQ